MTKKRNRVFRNAYEIFVTVLIVASIFVLAWFINSGINTAAH